ncbi:tetratricopeptide repeat protein [Patescibacteria group bacterium]|nr:tetratricopeptide repeat protein [Patescibacteria group bacterium]
MKETSKKERKIFKKDPYMEKYEKNIILFGLFTFIILSVISFVFIMPMLFGFYNNINPQQGDVADKNQYIQKNQTSSETNYKSGITLFDEKNYSSALDFFKKAIDEEPNNINYLTEYAITNYRLKNYSEAIKTYQRIIVIDENSVSSYNSIGNIYWIMENYDAAENNFKKAIEINPSIISAYNNYALMLDEKGQIEEAKEILQQGMEANSENTELKLTMRIIEGNEN